MEDQKHGISKTRTSIGNGGGGGFAGLLVVGGALAVTGIMAVTSFASKKNKAKGTDVEHDKAESLNQELLDDGDWKNEDEITQEQGLRSLLLQHSTANDGNEWCCPSFETPNLGVNQINSSALVSTQTMILEEKLDLKTKTEEGSPICFHQEIVLSDDSPPESAVSSTESGVGEECLSSLFDTDSPCFKGEECEGLKTIAIIQAQNEDATPETEDDIDDDEDDVESDYVLQSGQDSSDATGKSSLDSHEEAVWPAELMEEPEQRFKGEILFLQTQTDGAAAKRKFSADYCVTDSCISSDSSDYGGIDRAITPEAALAKVEKPNLCMLLSDEPSVSHSSKLTTCIIPMLLLALLLLLVLLSRGAPDSCNVLDDGSSVIVP